MLKLSERLYTLRKSKDLKQETAAKLCDISMMSYRRYETNEREPTAPTLAKMARFYHVSLDYLVGLKDERQ